MKVLHLSTWNEICGISTYTSNLVKGLDNLDDEEILSEIYPIKRAEIEYLSLQEIKEHFRLFCVKASDFDVVHIQHEHGFYHGSYPFHKSIDVFGEILNRLKESSARVVVTFHTDPIFVQKLDGSSISKLEKILRTASNVYQLWKWKFKISPFFCNKQNKFIAICHTKKSRLYLLKSGFSTKSIHIIKHGVSAYQRTEYESLTGAECKVKLGVSTDVKLLSIFGFIGQYKGYVTAVNALSYLPNNYQLFIIGSVHPNERKSKFIDELFELIDKLELNNRVHVTGYVDFHDLDLFRKATDIFLAPYLSSTLSASGALTWGLNSGKPVVASKIPAFYELNQEANCMLMFTPEASRELAWQIINLEQNEELKNKLVHSSLEYAKKNSWDNIALITKDLYKKMFS